MDILREIFKNKVLFPLLTLVFIAHVLVGIFMTPYIVVSDEMHYLTTSRNNYATRICNFVQKIPVKEEHEMALPNFIYPLIISPAFCLKSFSATYMAIKAINSVLICLGSLALFGIGYLLLGKKTAFALLILANLHPYTNFSGIVMVESLYYAAFYWFVLLCLLQFRRIVQFHKREIRTTILFSLFTAFLFLVKINLIFLPLFYIVAYVLAARAAGVNAERVLTHIILYFTAYVIALYVLVRINPVSGVGHYGSLISLYSQASFPGILNILIISGAFFLANMIFLPLFSLVPMVKEVLNSSYSLSKSSSPVRVGFYSLIMLAAIAYLFTFSIHVASVDKGYSVSLQNLLFHEREYGFLVIMFIVPFLMRLKSTKKPPATSYKFPLFVIAFIVVLFSLWKVSFSVGMEVIHAPTMSLFYLMKSTVWLYLLIMATLSFVVVAATTTRIISKSSATKVAVVFLAVVFSMLKVAHFYRIAFYIPPDETTRNTAYYPPHSQIKVDPKDRIFITWRIPHLVQYYRLAMTNSAALQVKIDEPDKILSYWSDDQINSKKDFSGSDYVFEDLPLPVNSLFPLSDELIERDSRHKTLAYKMAKKKRGIILSRAYYKDVHDGKSFSMIDREDKALIDAKTEYPYVVRESIRTFRLHPSESGSVVLRFDYQGEDEASIIMNFRIFLLDEQNKSDGVRVFVESSKLGENHLLTSGENLLYKIDFDRPTDYFQVTIDKNKTTDFDDTVLLVDGVQWFNQSLVYDFIE